MLFWLGRFTGYRFGETFDERVRSIEDDDWNNYGITGFEKLCP
ncbi:hypothetical protein ACMX25_30825 [Caballeronia sp. 15715]